MALVKYNNNSISAVTSAAAIPSGAMTHIKTLTASSSSTLSFVHGSSDVVLDSTYPIYLFKCINIHPSTNDTSFQVNFRDGGTDYDATKTSTTFSAVHNEDDSSASLSYHTGGDLAQGTGFQVLTGGSSNANDASNCVELFLFNPSSTTFAKHYLGVVSEGYTDGNIHRYVGGYCNVTAAIDAVQFKMNSGTMDAGTIKLYGIKDS